MPSKSSIYWLANETLGRLETFRRCVRENKRVLEAADFCRYLQGSGLLRLLKEYPQPFPLRVDPAELEKVTKDILFECGELFRKGKADPKYAESDIAAINHKLEMIAARVSQLAPPRLAADTKDAGSPALTVIEGGATERKETHA